MTKCGNSVLVGLFCSASQVHHPYPDTLAEDILINCFTEPRMQNEMFCQLMKQLSGNSKRRRLDSYSRAWALMCLLLSAFT